MAGFYDSSGLCYLLQSILNHDPGGVALEQLDISRNMLGQDMSLLTSLCSFIEADLVGLSVLNITGNCFGMADMTRLMQSVQLNTHIASYWRPTDRSDHSTPLNTNININLAGCNLSPLDFMLLRPQMEQPMRVQAADFSWNMDFGVFDLTCCCPHIGFPFVHLQSLRVSSISMDADFALKLREVMENPLCGLTSLDVSGNGLTLQCAGLDNLLLGLTNNTSLLQMSMVACVPQNYRSFDRIASAVKENKTLVELDLSQSIGCRFDAGPLLLALKENSSLKTLRLSRCEINSFGISHLSDMVASNKTLTCLDLSHNYICRFGWERDFDIVPALSLTIALRHLNTEVASPPCRVNLWAPVSYFPPALVATPMSTLRALNLSHNTLEYSVVAGIAESLKNSCLPIDSLDVGHCLLGERGGKVLGEALPRVSCLKTLLMKSNDIGVAGLEVRPAGIGGGEAWVLVVVMHDVMNVIVE